MKLLMFLLLPCLSLSEVGDNFNNCSQFFLNGVHPHFSKPLSPSIKHICQCLKVNGKVEYFYATLYNTAWAIPVYSAYEFGTPSPVRKDYWYIEPQLDGGNNAEPCMGTQGEATGANQALNRDYVGSVESGYDKGHLYPVYHTNNSLSMQATSTLTNAAPQNSSFNRIEWKEHERNVSNILKVCDQAYVVTGVVPKDEEYIPNNNNPRVRVSKYYWTATCCVKNNVFTGQGYYGPDIDNNGVNIVRELSITELQDKLAIDYNLNITIFPGVPRPSDCYGDKVSLSPVSWNGSADIYLSLTGVGKS